MPAQVLARDLTFSHGPIAVLAGVSVRLAPGHRLGVVGPNGVGKSTLLSLLAGELTPETGSVRRVPGDATVGLLRQELDAQPGETVVALLARRTGVLEADQALGEATAQLGVDEPAATERYTAALDRWMRLGGSDLHARIGETLSRVGLDPAMADQSTIGLSGGERARVGLAALLLSRFDVLLLDEPTNDLDQQGLAQLEEFVIGSDAAIALVSHDRHFLGRVVTDVLEIDEHTRTGIEFGGGWAAYLEGKSTARRHAEERHATYVDQRDRLKDRAQQERQWSVQGVTKAKKSAEPDKFIRHAKTERSEQLAGKARRTEQAMARLEVVGKPWEGWDLRFSIASAGRSGDLAAEMVGAVVEQGDFRLGPVAVTIGSGERVALVGPNGAGKTTLLRALLGEAVLAEGSQRVGRSVVVGRLDQTRERFAGGDSLIDGFVDDTGASKEESRSTLAKFGLGAEHIARPTDRLSPGERTRAVLAAFQVQGVNLLVLDEPTNHLDLPAIEQLEQALQSFEGTLLVVSHDRAFLDAIAFTRTIEVAAGQIVADTPT